MSIIDLSSKANQPFFSSCGNAAITFNGEIYNYESLKKEIRFNDFRTNSDTETIIEGYLDQGVSFFKRLRGVYSFAIVDFRNEQKVILARDPAGVKPLYFKEEKNKIIFGSEIKSIKKIFHDNLVINDISIKQYLNLGFIPEPSTVYKNLIALEPGNTFVWRGNGPKSMTPFFSYSYDNWNSNSFIENVENISMALDRAVQRNLVSDVNLSLALSGGIDSSLIYDRILKNKKSINALTISFKKNKHYDESFISERYSNEKQNHKIINLETVIDLELINKLFTHFDQPFADSSAIPVYLISKIASQNSKVIIGGDGGDELFNGYIYQRILPILKRISSFPRLINFFNSYIGFLPDNYYRKLKRLQSLMINQEAVFYNKNSWIPIWTEMNGNSVFNYQNKTEHVIQYSKIFSNDKPQNFQGMIIFDYFRKLMLGDYMRKLDMMSMLNGVEWRVPFLDEDLVKMAFSIPYEQKSNAFSGKKHTKYLHRKAYPSYTTNFPKHGFSIPLSDYLTLESRKQISEKISKKDNYVSEFISMKYIKYLSKQFIKYSDKRQISYESVYQRVLMLYVLENWHDSL